MRSDNMWIGVIGGLLAPIAGFFAYAGMYVTTIQPQHDLSYFVNDLFIGTKQYQAPVLSLALLANLALFFFFDRIGRPIAMRGVILATFIYGAAIVVLAV